jgi:hypothetical protein
MQQMNFKKVQSVQDLVSSCQRNGQMFNLQKAMPIMACDCNGKNFSRRLLQKAMPAMACYGDRGCDCDGKSFSKRYNISSI